MTSADAAGHRFLAAGEFLWMEEIARILKSTLGARAAKVPARLMPNIVFRLVAALAPERRSRSPLLGKMLPVTAEKARRLLQFAPRPASTTVVDTAASLMG